MYDVVVVGARCAGAPTAMLLAGAGYRVLLLEKDRYPRDSLSTNLIHPLGVIRLALVLTGRVGGDLGDTRRLDEALRRFATGRDALLMPTYQAARALARLHVAAQQVEFLRAVAASEELTTRYFGMIGGVVAPEELFTGERPAADPPAAPGAAR